MTRGLRILHLEDNPDYSDLVRSMLERDGIAADFTVAQTGKEFEELIDNVEFNLILADYLVPGYDGLQALRYARQQRPITPFLLVSGTIGEHAAIESLKSGATDYVLKQWPERLVPAIRRALQEAEDRIRREQAELELTSREKHFRAVTENALDVVTILNREGEFVYNSPSVERVLGYTPEQLQGTNAFDLVHPEDVARVTETFESGIRNHEAVTVEFRCRCADQSWRYLEVVGQNRLEDPEIGGVVINSRDVTERKRIQHRDAALSELGQRLSSATTPVEAAQIIVAVGDELFQWDAFTLNLYSEESGEAYPVLNVDTDPQGQRFEVRPVAEVMPTSAWARRVVEHGGELLLRQEPVTFSNGSIAIGDCSRPSASLMMVPIRNGTTVIGLVSFQSYRVNAYDKQDLLTLQTLADYCGGALERIRAEQALRDSEQRFRALFEGSPDAIFVEDTNGVVLDVNPAACALHGMTRQELVGKQVSELIPPECRKQAAADFGALVQKRISRVEGASWTKDGLAVPVELRANRVEYAGREALLLHVRDITERKQAEAALTSSETLFHSVWQNSVDGMRLTDEEGQMVAVNDAFCTLSGMRRDDLEGHLFTVIYSETDDIRGMLHDYRERFQRRGADKQAERVLRLRNGKVVTFDVSTCFVELPGKRPLLLGLFRDVTSQKALEEQLRQSQKMEAIGQLAGGVAHDFNNMLTVIHGHASVLAGAGSPSTLQARSAQQIVEAAERAAGLTRQLLTFSRRQVMQPRLIDVNELVANMTRMLARIVGEDITLQVNYSPQPAMVRADGSMLEQVLLNLAVNSRDAMPRGGQLALKILVRDLPSTQIEDHSERRGGRFVCLTAVDKGCGIAPENLPRIFEPFFTTKERGKGTGLGLATVYGIVKQHRGWIEVSSRVEEGTRFDVYLPFCNEPDEVAGQPSAAKRIRGGTETILVVEDEAPVRELVCNLLAGHGYRILEAESGRKALSLWEQCKDKVDLLLTDLVMPDHVDGRELAERLLAERPKLKVIFTSGYSADVVGKNFILHGGLNYLQKPYAPERLALAVRECLDALN